MPNDGSITGNIDRQYSVDTLPDRAAPLKQHGTNVVDRSFRQTTVPLNSPENILSTLMEAAGHVGTAAGTYMQQKIDEDKTVQSLRFYSGLAPSDDATKAGYRAHAVLAMNNKVLNSSARLKSEAETFTGTDDEWEQKVRDAQASDYESVLQQHPALKDDPLTSKAVATMYGEQVPGIAATRIGAKLRMEHEGRLNTFRDNLRVRTDGLTPEESDKAITGVMDGSDPLQLTKGEREKELIALAIERSENGDLSMIDYTKRYTGGQKTSLWERSNALQKAEISGKKVYWMKHQDQIATEKQTLQDRLDKGELTRDEFFAAAQGLNDKYSNLAYTDDSMIHGYRSSIKDKPWLVQEGYANAVGATIDELKSGKFNGNRAGFFARAGQDNVKLNGMVWTDNAMREAWEQHEKDIATNTDITAYTREFFTQTVAGSVPLGQRGLDSKTNDAVIEAAKKVINQEANKEIAVLPGNHTPQMEQAIRDKYMASYMQYLSASRLKDKEFERILSSFKLTDMADAPNMKNLNSNTERAIQLYTSMDEGAKQLHMSKEDRAVFENFLSYVEQGHPRVSAMEKAIFAYQHPRNVTGDDLKAVRAAAKSAADASTSRYGSKAGFFPGTVWMGLATETAPGWYQSLHREEAEKAVLANMIGGVLDAKAAAKLYRDGFEATHTQLPNGMWVKGTLPVLSDRMKVAPVDVPKVLSTYLEMNQHELEDMGHVPISEMYFVTNPERGTFQIKTRLGDTLNMPTPLEEMKRGSDAYLRNKPGLLDKIKGAAASYVGLSQPENHPEDREKLVHTIAYVEGNGGFDSKAGVFKPYRDSNGKQWNIGYGLRISDKEYNQDYIVRNGDRYNLGRLRPSQITLNVARGLLESELDRGAGEVRKYWKGYDQLPSKYQGVLMALHYNTGSVKPSNWPKLMEAMNNKDDEGVRREMVTSYTNKDGNKVVLSERAATVYKRLFNK